MYQVTADGTAATFRPEYFRHYLFTGARAIPKPEIDLIIKMYSVDCAVCATGHTVAVVKRKEQQSRHRHGFLYTREAFLVEYYIFCHLICMEISVPKIANKRHRQRSTAAIPSRAVHDDIATHTRARVNFLIFLFLFTLFTH